MSQNKTPTPTLYSRVPADTFDWVTEQAEYQQISQTDWVRLLLNSLMTNYSNKEVNKIFLGIKPTLSQRDVIRDKTSASKLNSKRYAKSL